VAQVAVVGVPDLRWGEVGRAWLELRPGAALSAEELGAWLQGRLARFKMPRQIEILDQLPRTGSGKIDRALLRQR
jgi:fatty-acyl-CoA synthase